MKELEDFPELVVNKNLLCLEHFKQGLNPNLLLNEDCHCSVPGNYIRSDKKHILFFAFQRISYFESQKNSISKTSNTDLYEFIKNTLLSLREKIDKDFIIQMAFFSLEYQKSTDFIDFLVENKLIDINSQLKGYTLLMGTKNRKKINHLIELGADVNVKCADIENPNFGKTAYDLAVTFRDKNWIDSLRVHLTDNFLEEKNKDKLIEFKQQSHIKKQFRLFINSLKENNIDITNEIMNNQNIYDGLIRFRDRHDKNLISYAAINNREEILLRLFDIKYYSENKNEKFNRVAYRDRDFLCYTSSVIESGGVKGAKILYKNNYRSDEHLINFMSQNYYVATDILNMMIDDGFKPQIDLRMKHLSDYRIDEDVFTRGSIKDFFIKNRYFLNMKDMYKKEKYFVPMSLHNEVEVKNFHIKILSFILSKQKLLDPEEFEINFNKIIGGIGQNPKNIGLKFASMIMHNFPEYSLIDKLSIHGKNDWLIKLNKDTLESELMKVNEEDRPVKKVKI